MLFKKYKLLFLFLILSAILAGVLYFVTAYLFQGLITQLSSLKTTDTHNLTIGKQYQNLIIYLVVFLGSVLLNFLISLVINFAYYKLEMNLSFNLFKEQILEQNISKSMSVSKDKKLFMLTGAIANIVFANGIAFIHFFSTLIFLVAIITTLGYFAPYSLAYIVPLALIAIVVPMLFKKQSNKYAHHLQKAKAQPYETDLTALKAIKTYKLNNSQNLLEWYKKQEKKYKKTTVNKLAKSRLPLSFSHLFAYYTIFLLMILCTMFLTIYRQLEIGVLSLILLSAKNLADKGVVIITNYYDLNNSKKIAQESIHNSSVSDKDFAVDNFQEINYPDELKTLELHIDNFTFPNSKPLFKEIDLKIKINNQILITGSSGSGKSTLLKILLGAYPFLDSYQIKRNDYLITDLQNSQLNLHKDIYFVKNNNNLFVGSVLENITLGDSSLNELAIQLALEFNLSYELLQSQVTLENTPLSVGQSQRVAIIQALVSGKKFFVFDDSFSNIDVQNTGIILNYLKVNQISYVLVSNTIGQSNLHYFSNIYNLTEGQLYEKV
ncbi:ATP-binding cassette domain-containing protein [Mycoplasma buteonis]|uniref:ATP-binding cassette domain-containing protein n=1 Tax=Mycoplasma buteonis TaxID=171280 RepID=UPI00056AA143|nr:ABC transporter ATP-binding protein [Mycoplasma buteonis]